MILNTSGQKILIVEPDRAVLEMLQIRLDVAGYHALVARTVPAALEILQTSRPDAMILELKIPEMDGFDLLETIRRRSDLRAVPTLVMGRNLSPDDIQNAVRLGARDVLAKPFSGADMLDRVMRLLRRPAAATAVAAAGTYA